jgi:hypothetical protein
VKHKSQYVHQVSHGDCLDPKSPELPMGKSYFVGLRCSCTNPKSPEKESVHDVLSLISMLT